MFLQHRYQSHLWQNVTQDLTLSAVASRATLSLHEALRSHSREPGLADNSRVSRSRKHAMCDKSLRMKPRVCRPHDRARLFDKPVDLDRLRVPSLQSGQTTNVCEGG